MPIGNHRAKEQLAANRYQRDRADTQLAALKQPITHDVRLAVRSLYDGAAAIDAAVASRRLAVRNLEAEQTKFNNGLSTNFQVSEIQRALADAQFAEIRARVNYRKLLAAYYAFTGTFLEAIGVQIADPGDTRLGPRLLERRRVDAVLRSQGREQRGQHPSRAGGDRD